MIDAIAHLTIKLDISTMSIVASAVAAMLGLFLLLVWGQDRTRALAWWGCAYVLGGLAISVWSIEPHISQSLPTGFANALVFIACGVVWNAVRLFYGRPVLWGALMAGGTAWLIASLFPGFANWTTARIVLCSLIIASYVFLTSAELWQERRHLPMRRWAAVFIPILHGTVFLSPIALARLLPSDAGNADVASGWIAVYVLGIILYVVGTAFVALAIAKERAMRIHKSAALTDDLTGVFNRRGFLLAGESLVTRLTRLRKPASVLMCDLDGFKSINDRFGHMVGDAALRAFGVTTMASIRDTDIMGRLGGEEFAIILPGTIEDATVVANRVRAGFKLVGATVADCKLDATVSIGAASGPPGTDVMTLLARADAALYRAKNNGRNRIETAADVPARPEPALFLVSDQGHPPHVPAVHAPTIRRVF